MGDVTQATVDQIINNAKIALETYDFGTNAAIYKSALIQLIKRMDNEIIKIIFEAETGRPTLSSDPTNIAFAGALRNIQRMHTVRRALMDAFRRADELDPAS